MTRLDTNYILRYLLNDDEKMASIAEEVILHKEVHIANEVWAEVVYVLEGVYELEKEEISDVLSSLLKFDTIKVIDKYTLFKALELFAWKKLDFVDCLLCASASVDEILTFDKKLQRCVDRQKDSI